MKTITPTLTRKSYGATQTNSELYSSRAVFQNEKFQQFLQTYHRRFFIFGFPAPVGAYSTRGCNFYTKLHAKLLSSSILSSFIFEGVFHERRSSIAYEIMGIPPPQVPLFDLSFPRRRESRFVHSWISWIAAFESMRNVGGFSVSRNISPCLFSTKSFVEPQ